MHPAQQVRFFADTVVPPGTTARAVCPQCSGGASREQSLAVTKGENGDILWFCHRASCGFTGSSVVGWYDEEHVKPLQKTRLFTGSAVNNPKHLLLFKDKYGFIPDRLSWCPEYERYIQPIFGPYFEERGVTLRCIDGSKQPKTLTYPAIGDQPFIHWSASRSSPAVYAVVEDWISAEKISAYVGSFVGICLNGTHLDYTRSMEIARVAGSRPVVLCLDNDATSKAFKYCEKYRGLIKKLLVYPLEKDIKDLDSREIYRIYDYGASFSC